MTLDRVLDLLFVSEPIRLEYPVGNGTYDSVEFDDKMLLRDSGGYVDEGLSNWDKMELDPAFRLDDEVANVWVDSGMLVITLADSDDLWR
jgi:hypothetical protein